MRLLRPVLLAAFVAWVLLPVGSAVASQAQTPGQPSVQQVVTDGFGWG